MNTRNSKKNNQRNSIQEKKENKEEINSVNVADKPAYQVYYHVPKNDKKRKNENNVTSTSKRIKSNDNNFSEQQLAAQQLAEKQLAEKILVTQQLAAHHAAIQQQLAEQLLAEKILAAQQLVAYYASQQLAIQQLSYYYQPQQIIQTSDMEVLNTNSATLTSNNIEKNNSYSRDGFSIFSTSETKEQKVSHEEEEERANDIDRFFI